MNEATTTKKSKKNTYYLGAHLSTAGGFDKAIDRSLAIGANAVQIFSGSPRVWARKPIEQLELDKLSSKVKENAFGPIITHSLYLLNLASDKPELLEKSLKALAYDLAFDAAIGGSGIVVHVGSHQGRGWESCRDDISQRIAKLLLESPANSRFLIENSAGQKGKLCSDLSEIRWLIDAVRALLPQEKHHQIGWCIDTCHAHAAGYDLAPDGLEGRGSLIAAVSKFSLWSDLGCIHVNDSRDAFGSGRDRHANLGQGEIPTSSFQAFLSSQEVLEAGVPLILEVPGLDNNGPDKANLDVLKSWLGVN